MSGLTRLLTRLITLCVFSLAFTISARAEEILLKQGSRVELGTNVGVITKAVTLPYVDSEYTRLFRFDSAGNPKLKELRERYNLRDVIAAGKDEFEQQILLMEWVHNRFQKFGQPSKTARGALEILGGIEAGETFFCTQYAQLFASASAALGWVDRVLALRRHRDAGHQGSTEHSTTEIWSNQHRKWVMLDPTSNIYLEREGVPLNAFEIREEWFYKSGTNLTFVIGKERRRYRKSDLPIVLRTFPGFGDLTIDPHELDKYGFIGYIPNTDLMDAGFDYGGMFITKDRLCDGTQWHKRKLPENPAIDPYFPINQAALKLAREKEGLSVELKTLTPNLKTFEAQVDNAAWRGTAEQFTWKLHPGTNKLQVRARNQLDVAGPISLIELKVAE